MSRLTLALLAFALATRCGPGMDAPPPGGGQPPPPPQTGRFAMELVTSLPQFPVAMAFTSSTRVLITEKGGFGGVRPASVRIVESGTLVAEPLITFAEVETRSEMGLLGIALDPDYAANRLVYAYYTHGPSRRNRVVRFRDDGRLSQRDQDAEIVIGNIPADVCGNHQGGNIAFGRDRMLYVTVGDNGCNRCLSQSGETLAGKILRYTRDGGVPGDNPFASAPPPASSFFATGLRNSFDFTFHPTTGEIFATENGPNTNDELNRILRGQNYGWPYFECEQSINPPCSFDRPPNTAPLRCYPSVIAPTGLAFYTGSRYPSAFRGNLFFGDNNTGTLRRVVLDPSGTRIDSVDEAFLGGFGRIVDVVDAPDGLLYVLTDRDLRRVDFIPGG